MKDHFALRRQLLQTLKNGIATIPHDLALIPLCGIGDRHPHYGLKAFESMPRQPQVVAGKH